ncbi:hypothetical protein ACIODT_32075 [Streptomyces sp. NPDC088251]|uniref:hypothetical protein n=1 Tax=Streptomyces sp. NPDC088251 TaxID=3365844 RepID=UPI0037F299F6
MADQLGDQVQRVRGAGVRGGSFGHARGVDEGGCVLGAGAGQRQPHVVSDVCAGEEAGSGQRSGREVRGERGAPQGGRRTRGRRAGDRAQRLGGRAAQDQVFQEAGGRRRAAGAVGDGGPGSGRVAEEVVVGGERVCQVFARAAHAGSQGSQELGAAEGGEEVGVGAAPLQPGAGR